MYRFTRDELSSGGRVFVVLPRIDGEGARAVKAVRETVARLRREVFPGYGVGELHGRMSLEERVVSMDSFRSGDLQGLVATTVVEVGIDVPEAAVMIIEHAERFGLAQLHQLRGRVGRGTKKSRCFLVPMKNAGEEARRRLDVMTRSDDGFTIAEEDLAIRGPGDFLGTRQSGLPRLQVADLRRDGELLLLARDEAEGLLRRDRELALPGHHPLRNLVDRRWEAAADGGGSPVTGR
jgi:ATP-dependent DNA helicase RecG